MHVDTQPVRQFLAGVTTPVVEIATADLLKLLDAADRPINRAACVPSLGGRGPAATA